MRDRINLPLLPPFVLVAHGVERTVVGGAEGHGPFVTHLAAHGPRLGVADIAAETGNTTPGGLKPRSDRT